MQCLSSLSLDILIVFKSSLVNASDEDFEGSVVASSTIDVETCPSSSSDEVVGVSERLFGGGEAEADCLARLEACTFRLVLSSSSLLDFSLVEPKAVCLPETTVRMQCRLDWN